MIRERLSPFRCGCRTLNRQFEGGERWELSGMFDEDDGEIIEVNGLPSVIFYEDSRAGQMRRQQRKISMGEIQRVRVKRFAVI